MTTNKTIEEMAEEYSLAKFPIQWVEFPKDFKQDINYSRRLLAKIRSQK